MISFTLVFHPHCTIIILSFNAVTTCLYVPWMCYFSLYYFAVCFGALREAINPIVHPVKMKVTVFYCFFARTFLNGILLL